jgi:hypothetical protein
MRLVVAALTAAALVAASLSSVVGLPALAQGDPPELGDVILEDSLASASVTAP